MEAKRIWAMKRSEAVLIIAESLIEPRHDDAMKEASYILKRLEVRGMNPPTLKHDPSATWDDRLFGWEDEDIPTEFEKVFQKKFWDIVSKPGDENEP